MAAKREREEKVQIWLDPEDDNEARILDTLKHFMKERGMSKKHVVMWAVEVLRASEWRNDFTPTEGRFEQLEYKLNLILEKIENGTFSTPEERLQAIDDFKKARKNLGEMEQSISNRYRELDFDDES